ncbi:MAG: PhnD/SsuA/transferrin family substrate-binding protein [Rhizobiaceae bacterium]
MGSIPLIAALPMYDWPEAREETDAEWARLKEGLAERGVAAPPRLTRRNGDMPAVPGGITDRDGRVIAPDPATLPPDEFDVHVLWRHPGLLLAQTCWGPLEQGLANHVTVIGQPDYSAQEGGQGEFYRSAIVMRAGSGAADVPAPGGPDAAIDVEALRGTRFTYNGADSMSGIIALRRDLARLGAIANEAAFEAFWSGASVSGGHRQSVIAVAEGAADVAAIDCRSLDLCRRFEPATEEVRVVGWTALRKGLPYIAAPALAQPISLSSSG